MARPASMPTVLAAAATVTTDTVNLRLLQWVDDAGDVADTNSCAVTINGTALTTVVQKPSDVGDHRVVLWQIGPFNPGIPVKGIVVDTLTKGGVHVWFD